MSGVDVVTVVHDHAATLAATLASLNIQTVRPATVVVVDNASTDGSSRVAAGFAGLLPLQVVRLPSNRGFSAAANEGLRRCSSSWVLSLNPDCRLAPDYLELLVGGGEAHEGTGAATGLLLRARGAALEATDMVDSAGMEVYPSGRHLDRGAGRPPRSTDLEQAWVFGASGAAALYRREALEDVAYPGGEFFDEGFFAYREDADLAWRLQRRGWSCLYLPTARGYHSRGLKPEARRRGSTAINYHSTRNRFLLRLANADWRWHLACFPAWLVRDLMVVAACLTIERSSLPALGEALAMRHKQRQRGRANASRARVSGWTVARWFLPGGRVRRLSH